MKTPWLLAVKDRETDEVEIIGFPTEKSRTEFLADANEKGLDNFDFITSFDGGN